MRQVDLCLAHIPARHARRAAATLPTRRRRAIMALRALWRIPKPGSHTGVGVTTAVRSVSRGPGAALTRVDAHACLVPTGPRPTGQVQLSTLLLAEHKGGALQPNTLHALTAAVQLGGPVTVLVAGDNAVLAAAAASQASGVAAVLTAEDPCLAHGLAEPMAALLHAVHTK